MSTDHIVLGGAVAVFAAALLYALTRKGSVSASVAMLAAPLQRVDASTPRLGGLVKELDAQALDQGATELERQIVATLAQSHKARLQAALAPKDQAAPSPPPA